MAKLELTLPESTVELLRRAQEVLAQKQGKAVKLAEVLAVLGEEFLEQQDPVRKAERALKKVERTPQENSDPPNSTLHVKDKIPAREKHQVHQRDQGKCQFKQKDGKICGSPRWLHIHHIRPREYGGDNRLENLVTLCSAHHKIVHDHAQIHATRL